MDRQLCLRITLSLPQFDVNRSDNEMCISHNLKVVLCDRRILVKFPRPKIRNTVLALLVRVQ